MLRRRSHTCDMHASLYLKEIIFYPMHERVELSRDQHNATVSSMVYATTPTILLNTVRVLGRFEPRYRTTGVAELASTGTPSKLLAWSKSVLALWSIKLEERAICEIEARTGFPQRRREGLWVCRFKQRLISGSGGTSHPHTRGAKTLRGRSWSLVQPLTCVGNPKVRRSVFFPL